MLPLGPDGLLCVTYVYIHTPSRFSGSPQDAFRFPTQICYTNNSFDIVFHSECVVSRDDRHGIITAVSTPTQVVDVVILRAGMAQQRSTDVPYIPDCIESGDEATQVLSMQDVRQGLLDTQYPPQPQPRRRRHRAGRQVREARERRERELEERAARRATATGQAPQPRHTDLSLPTPLNSTPPPTRKVARVAPFVREQFPFERSAMGRGQQLRCLLNAPALLPPPSNWDHGDGRPIGDLDVPTYNAGPLALFVRRRTGRYNQIHLPTGPRVTDCRLIARVEPIPHVNWNNFLWDDFWG